MPVDATPDTTQLLLDARSGRREAFDALLPKVYEALRVIAHRRLREQHAGETLNTTALVHEAYLRLINGERVQWQDRAHFFALASRAMRFVLVDYARAHAAGKRGGPGRDLPLSAFQVQADERAEDLLALDEALSTLAARDERLSTLVEYRFFGGLTYDEIAEVSGRSVPTVKRDWQRARTWLYVAMTADPAPPGASPL